MKRFAVIAALFALAAYVVGCTHHIENRYRLTVEVQTPEGPKTGTGVIDVSRRILYSWAYIPGDREDQRITGEAVSVDLGQRGVLFVLLTCKDEKNNPQDCGALKLPERVLRRRGEVSIRASQGQSYTDWLVEKAGIVAAARGPRSVDERDLPMMVRFRDLNDPKSVEAVDPLNLAASFGAGVKLGQVTLEMTSDAVTRGIDKNLPWLGGLKTTLSGDRIVRSNSLSNNLGQGSFRRM